jgi:hypothetical protein
VILFVVLIVAAAATLNSIDGAAVKTNSLVRGIRSSSNADESETERATTSKRRNLAPADDEGVLDTKASKSSKKNSKGGGYYGSTEVSSSTSKASKAKSNKSCKKSAKSTDEG